MFVIRERLYAHPVVSMVHGDYINCGNISQKSFYFVSLELEPKKKIVA